MTLSGTVWNCLIVASLSLLPFSLFSGCVCLVDRELRADRVVLLALDVAAVDVWPSLDGVDAVVVTSLPALLRGTTACLP